jgi:hypothetical protein
MSGIQHARDIRMCERSQDLTFLQKAPAVETPRAGWQQFHRDALGYLAIGTLSQIHSSHAAAPDNFHQPVWPATTSTCVKQRERSSRSDTDVPHEEFAGARIERQQRLYFPADLLVHKMLGEVLNAGLGRQVR